MDDKKIPVVALVGPTASGKTALSVKIAQHFGGEVISADSMQIYKGMSIATAKPTAEEMCGIKHYMLDFLPPEEKYSVARYVEEASAAIDEAVASGHLPIVCGGTGLYVDSLLGNMSFAEEKTDTDIRQKLVERCENEGIEVLYSELQSIDPEYAATVHINNRVRVIRALEIYYQTGQKPTVVRKNAVTGESRYNPLYICLDYKDRSVLYDRIDRRVDIMLENGLLEEAEKYLPLAGKTAVQAIGYKELAPYLRGEASLEEALSSLKYATHRYAKRQLTWFRRNEKINILYPDAVTPDELVKQAISLTEDFLKNFS